MKERKLKTKLLRALEDGYLSYQDLVVILKCKNHRSLQALVDVINDLYNEDKVLLVKFGDEKGLILTRK